MRIEQFIERHHATLSRQGGVQASFRRGRGPYYRVVCREDGKQLTCYVGNDFAKVESVRRALAELRRPRVLARLHRRVESDLRRHLRRAKQRLAAELAEAGLHLKGYEVRGWRAASLGSSAWAGLGPQQLSPVATRAGPAPYVLSEVVR